MWVGCLCISIVFRRRHGRGSANGCEWEQATGTVCSSSGRGEGWAVCRSHRSPSCERLVTLRAPQLPHPTGRLPCTRAAEGTRWLAEVPTPALAKGKTKTQRALTLSEEQNRWQPSHPPRVPPHHPSSINRLDGVGLAHHPHQPTRHGCGGRRRQRPCWSRRRVGGAPGQHPHRRRRC